MTNRLSKYASRFYASSGAELVVEYLEQERPDKASEARKILNKIKGENDPGEENGDGDE